MNREEAKTIVENFIKNTLLRNENDEYNNDYVKLYTSRGKEFIIYKKNQENSIYVKPKEGNQNFSESVDRILDYYIDNKTNHHADKSYVAPISDYIFGENGNRNILPIIVMTHNPKGKWGDVRPKIDKDGYYKGWNKSINVNLGQTVLIYITANIGEIQYIMKVEKVEDDTIDLELVKKLSSQQSQKLSRLKLQENGLKSGTINYILNNNKPLYEYVTSILDMKDKNMGNQIKTKNIMLYGAPGVGKTYNYKKLVSLIEGGDFKEDKIFDFIINNKDDEIEEGSVDKLFENIKQEKRIEFVTFHQSYSYEDFIEGFRPCEDDNRIVRKDGIFKIISDKARENLKESKKDINTIKEEKTFFELFDLFKDYIQEEIETHQKFIINDTAYIINIEEDAFRYTGDNWGNTQRMKFSDIELLNELNITQRKEIKKTNGLSGLANQHATYFSYFMQKFNEFKNKQNIKIENVEQIKEKNFYIIIDEINRGNISKVFGELITLIEEDKRGKNEYEVILPYSKKSFLIPENLYIIATMNSTDKSIATIDIALRRRFTFLKMKPNIDLVPDIAKELFEKLNEHITKVINEDYKLGHSYFMTIENEEDFKFVKKYKIQPLLEEYFYGDEKNYNEAIEILYTKTGKIDDK